MSCPLYIRSVYSLLSSMCTIDGIVSYGKKYGYTHLGLVDRNVLAGAMSFKKACEKAEIHPVYGLEFEIRIEDRTHVAILYAKNDAGFENLMKLSSHICTGEDRIIDIETLNRYRGECILVLLSDDMPLTYAADRDMNLQEALDSQRELFGEYTVGLMDHDIAMNANRDRKIKELLKKNRVPMIALNRTYYLER
ncbi:MAG: PHP domain-containing protein, partial [Erysipelotrichaceae bacterium]|nr:PHP domain-containing protein [Erysipelotrichaceae bacterium]